MSVDDLRVLKGILSDSKFAQEFAQTADTRVFEGDNKKLADFFTSYVKVYKTAPTRRVLDEKVKNPELKEQLVKLWDAVEQINVTSAEHKYDLDKLNKRFKENRITQIKQSIGDVGSEIFLKRMHDEISEIEAVIKPKNKTFIQKSLDENVSEFREKYNFRSKNKDNKDLFGGMQTRFSALDFLKGGLFPSELTLIGAATGGGKSLLMLSIAINLFLGKNTIFTDPSIFSKAHNVLYFSLEMPYDLCYNRILSNIADVPTNSLRDGCLLPSEVESVERVLKFLKKYPQKFDIVDMPRGLSLREAEKIYEETCEKGNIPDLVVFDYMAHMVTDGKDDDDHLKLLEISEGLHELARKINKHVMSAFQLNVPNAKTKDMNELVGLHRIGRSRAIMNSADLGMMILTRGSPAEENTYSDIPVHLLKNRTGALGSFNLLKKLAHSKILDQDPPFITDNSPNISVSSVEDLSGLLG